MNGQKLSRALGAFVYSHERPHHLVGLVFRHYVEHFVLFAVQRTAEPVAHRAAHGVSQRARSTTANAYEIGPYALGNPQLLLHKKLAKQYVKPDSPVYKYWFE